MTTLAAPAPAPTGARPEPGVGFRTGISLHREPDDVVVLALDDRSAFRLRHVEPGLADGLARLVDRPEAVDAVGAGLPEHSRDRLRALLPKVAAYLAPSLLLDGRTLLTVEGTAPGAAYDPVEVKATDRVRLTKFAHLRRRGDVLVLESPAGPHRATLPDPAARAVVVELGETVTAARLSRDDLPVSAVTALLGHLVGAGLAEVAAGDAFASDTDEVTRQWEFHDLLFHARSRIGRTDEPFGGRFPYTGQIEPQPPVRDLPAGEAIALPRPEYDAVSAADPTLLAAMEARQSVRQYGEAPMTLDQLGEFLYRVARVRGTYGPRPDRSMPYAGSSRPFPCGGAAYELELYATIRRCEGLAPASYFYDPAGHQLIRLGTDERDRTTMLELATLSSGGIAVPDVLLTVTSRFRRLSWKYQSIAYAVTLKHVGVLYQTMYLVATAMGLGACGLGSGDADLSARAFGLDYLQESSVGDFLLGSLPAEVPAPETTRAAADWHAGNDPQWQARALADVRSRRGGAGS